MRLMDFTAVPEADPWASFVYVMPHGPHRIFVEETSLVGRPAVELDVLEARLRARLATWGLEVQAETGVERCHIPMGGALPDFKHEVLTYGAAAGMTHPATGYQLTHALRCAAPAAQALADHIDEPSTARQAFWAAVWPREKQRLWQLYRFGMEVLLRMDQSAQRAFFAGFFELSPQQQVAWLAGTLTVKEASSVMWTVFKHIPGGLRARLIGHGMRPHGWRMLGALMG
jgi:lycopene beta-cyclase